MAGNADLERFAALHAALLANGFVPDTASWLRAHDLLLCLAREGRLPPEARAWRAYLAPLLCTSQAQQEAFYRIFTAWAGGTQTTTALPTEVRDPPVVVQTGMAAEQRRLGRLSRGGSLIVLLCTTLFVINGSGFREWLDARLHPLAPYELPLGSPSTASGAPVAAGADIIVHAPRDIPVAPVPPRYGIAPLSHVQPLGMIMRLGLLALPALLAAWWLLEWWQRRADVLRRISAHGEDPFEHMRLSGGTRRPFWHGSVPRLLHRLRRGAPLEISTLDIDRTVERSVRQAGLFVPVKAERHWRPEYLVLVERSPDNLHLAGLAAALCERMEQDGLKLHRYEFERSSILTTAYCFAVPGKGRHLWRDLVGLHARARLLVIADSRAVFHPLTQQALPALAMLGAWEERVWLTDRPAPWGHHEFWLSTAGFAVAPLSSAGFEAACRWYGQSTRHTVAPWFEPGAPTDYPAMLKLDPKAWLKDSPPRRRRSRPVDRRARRLRRSTWSALAGSNGRLSTPACRPRRGARQPAAAGRPAVAERTAPAQAGSTAVVSARSDARLPAFSFAARADAATA